jgi:hypothetical protein
MASEVLARSGTFTWLLGLSILAGGAIALVLDAQPMLGVALAAALIGFPLLLLRPLALGWLGLLAILVFEEFPAGLGETVERSIRAPLYGSSLGLPGFYMTDLILLGAISVNVLSMLLARRHLKLPGDPVTLSLAAMASMAVLSIVASFVSGDPFAYGVIQESPGTGFEVNERAAKLIALFQFKNYAYLFFAWLLGILMLQREQDVSSLLRIIGFAVGISSLIGLNRLVSHSEWVAQTIPVFYDSPSVWLFAGVCFFSVAAWAHGVLTPRQSLGMFTLSGLLALFIIVSFRRTMWGGIVFCVPMLLALLPAPARRRAIRNFVLVGLPLALVLALSPIGAALSSSVLERLGQTNTGDLSTLYRLAIFKYVTSNFSDIPWLGFGARPLWNEFVELDGFRTNMENVHSLYYWLLLRTGWIGAVVSLGSLGTMVWVASRLARTALDKRTRALGTVLTLAITLFLFSGLFNPVCIEARYTIMLGFGLALLSRLMQFDRLAITGRQLDNA